MNERMTAADFVEGILAVAASAGLRRYSMATNTVDVAMGAAYQALRDRLAAEHDVLVRFRVQPHPVHGSSPIVRSAIEEAVSEHFLARRNPSFRYIESTLYVDDSDSLDEFLSRLPGDPTIYHELAKIFVANVSGESTAESSSPVVSAV